MRTSPFLASLAVGMLVAATTLRAAPPCDPTPVNLTDAEKAKIRELVKLMWKMATDTPEHNAETLDACLNPPTQMGSQSTYEKSHSKDFGDSNARIADAVRIYLQMMRSNNLQKNPCSGGGGATSMQPGLDNDKVQISGKLLATWCDPTATAQARASAKFWIMATLANESTHVYQKDPPFGTPPWDPVRCDEERDSDLMSIKFLERLKSLLTDSSGNPRTLAQISAQGRAGQCLAMCLMNIGVDTPAELADIVADVMARYCFYVDRETNLFNAAINAGMSWRQLYYRHTYANTGKLGVDDTMFPTMRKLKLPCGPGAPVVLMVPEDGKTVVSYTVTTDSMGRTIIIVVTRGADGSMCIWTFTDTNGDGVPENNPSGVAFPPIFIADILPAYHDVWTFSLHLNSIGFNDSILLHDRRNGSLAAVELTDAGTATGAFRFLLRSPLIALPSPSNPTAGPFHTLLQVDENLLPGSIRFVFTSEEQFNIGPQSAALIGTHSVAAGTWVFQSATRAVGFAPRNPLGPDYLPIRSTGLNLMGNPGDTLRLDSVGYGAPQLITINTINTNGLTAAGSPPTQAGPDIFRLTSLSGGGAVEHQQARSGIVLDVIDHDLVGGPNPDTLVLSGFPGRLALFSGDPLPNAYQFFSEIATQDANPGVLDSDSPAAPVFLANADGDVQLRPIPGTPLLAQQLADLDGNGLADDAVVIARTPESSTFFVYMVINALSPTPFWLNSGPVPIEPAGFSYVDINHDSMSDVRIENAGGGSPYCLVSNGFGGFMPVPCPAITGVCCRGATCNSTIPQSACIGNGVAGALFIPGPAVCNIGSTSVPCCHADYNKSGAVSIADVFDFLNSWFAGSPFAIVGGNGNAGPLAIQNIFDFLSAWFAGCP